jgi:hypothetical protein
MFHVATEGEIEKIVAEATPMQRAA